MKTTTGHILMKPDGTQDFAGLERLQRHGLQGNELIELAEQLKWWVCIYERHFFGDPRFVTACGNAIVALEDQWVQLNPTR